MIATKVPSRTTPGLVYTVTRHPDGEYTCDCAGFEFRRHCWHVDHVSLIDALDDADRALRARPQPARISEAGRMAQHMLDV